MGLFDFLKKGKPAGSSNATNQSAEKKEASRSSTKYDNVTQEQIDKWNNPSNLDNLIETIRSKNSDKNRNWAGFRIRRLVNDKKFGDQQIEKIINSLSDIFSSEKSGEVRWELMIVLKDLNKIDPRITQVARSGILDSHWGVRVIALDYITKTGDVSLIQEALENLKNEKDSNVLSNIQKAREKVGKPLAVAEIIDKIKDNSKPDHFRVDNLRQLEKYKDPQAMQFLVHSLKRDPSLNFYAPGVAAIALKNMNDPGCVPYLLDIIKNASINPNGADAVTPDVVHAVDVLGNVGDPSVIPVIEDLRSRIIARGIKSENVRTEYAAGTISTNDQIRYFDSAISSLKNKQ